MGRRMVIDGGTGMTEEKAMEYLRGGGLACPYCGSRGIYADWLDADGPLAGSKVRCGDCRESWKDVYTLSGVEPEGDGAEVTAFTLPPPAVLITVSGGVADYSASEGVDVILVDRDVVKETSDADRVGRLVHQIRSIGQPAGLDADGSVLDELEAKLDSLEEDDDEEGDSKADAGQG
jgi:hypothetical protein